MGRVFSGIQPSGNLTLGNYLGALHNWIPLQEVHECFFCIVNLHAITVPQSPEALRQASLELAALYIAAGINPEKSHLFIQSHVPAHRELAWILNCFTPLGWLNRMTQFKDKVGKNREQANLGLYAYPVLMAADVLLYKATHVPVGEDQKQHLELARDIAGAFNRFSKTEYFPLPEPLIQGPAPRVMSLRDGTKKMSKSDSSEFSRIHLLDENDVIAAKIQKAKTDAEPLPLALKDLDERPEAKNLVTIYSALAKQMPKDVLQKYAGSSFSHFKPALTDLIISVLEPLRENTKRLLGDKTILEDHLRKGKDYARLQAESTLKEVESMLGFI